MASIKCSKKLTLCPRTRQTERAGKRQGGEEDYDEGVEEQLEDEDDEDVYILSKVAFTSFHLYCAM